MKHNWEYKRLGDVCEILNGYAFKSKLYIPNNGLRIIRIANVQDGYISDEAPQYYPLSYKNEINKYILQGGDLLMSLTGNVGRVGFLPQEMLPAALNQRVACLRFGSDIFKKFIFYRFRNKYFVSDCLNAGKGIAQLNLSTEWLKEYIVPVPSKEIQERIVAELDKINELIEVKREQLKQLDSLAQSLFYDTFGDPVTNPKGWATKKLNLVSELINGRAYKQDELLDKGKYRIVRVGNFFTNKDYYYSDLELSEDKYLNNGDLLFAWSASFGAFIWEGEKVIYHYHIWKVLYDENILNKIFYKYLLNEMTLSFMKDLHGIGMMHLTKVGMEQYILPIPPLYLQQQFAAQVEAIEAQKATVEKSIAELQTLLDSRMDYWFN